MDTMITLYNKDFVSPIQSWSAIVQKIAVWSSPVPAKTDLIPDPDLMRAHLDGRPQGGGQNGHFPSWKFGLRAKDF